jgi:hypothetical protein
VEPQRYGQSCKTVESLRVVKYFFFVTARAFCEGGGCAGYLVPSSLQDHQVLISGLRAALASRGFQAFQASWPLNGTLVYF